MSHSGGSALLGAPLIHDFAVISLSDLMTPWEKIEKRLESSARADFCIVLCNPMSKKRKDYLHKACEILRKTISEDTPCGWAKKYRARVKILNSAKFNRTKVP